jgi:hypothetical protein
MGGVREGTPREGPRGTSGSARRPRERAEEDRGDPDASARQRAHPSAREGRSPLADQTMKGRMVGANAQTIRQPRDRNLGQPQERQHSDAAGGTRDRLPPARGALGLSNSREWCRRAKGSSGVDCMCTPKPIRIRSFVMP